ncbi:unnamed protein product [Trichogramma brassicae]|uniref:C-type lectin domain-containing protein n=1 Tax=Trichogramma brassicae TaxID=86971 RepID=A0A6H5IJG4_9HYME|nr:unnamed protein product [Trichogramma brassicae]
MFRPRRHCDRPLFLNVCLLIIIASPGARSTFTDTAIDRVTVCSGNNRTLVVDLNTTRLTDQENAIDTTDCKCVCKSVDQTNNSSSAAIREDYVHTPGIGAYKLHTNGKQWNDARKICTLEGAHLAIINSQAEESLLVEMLWNAASTIKNVVNVEEAFIGIHDLFQQGEWVTVFGESLYATGYSAWSATYWNGQPDNFGGSQHCGAVLRQGGMDDVHCLHKFAFFCELPPKPSRVC